MVTMNELIEERRHKIKSLQDMSELILSEDRNYTPDEQERMDALEVEIADYDTDIGKRQETEARLVRSAKQVERLSEKGERKTPYTQPNLEGGPPNAITTRKAHYPRFGKMVAFKDGEEEIAHRCGRWLYAAMGHGMSQRWCDKHDVEYRAMSEGINTAGGVFVRDELSQRIIDLRETHGVFRQNTTIEPMGSDVKDIIRQKGGLTANFVAEGGTIGESTSNFDNVKLVAKKLTARTRISAELDEDAMISVVDRFAVDVAKSLAEKEDQCGFNGTGAATFGSIVGTTQRFENNILFAGYLNATNIDLFSEITNAHISTAIGTLPGYVTEPKIYCSKACWANVFQRLAVAGGGNTIDTLRGGLGFSYLGMPIVISQVLQSAVTSLDLETMFMVGDLALASTMGDRRGITISRDDSVHWTTDQIALKATERFDIVNHDVGDATTAGPIVAWVGSV